MKRPQVAGLKIIRGILIFLVDTYHGDRYGVCIGTADGLPELEGIKIMETIDHKLARLLSQMTVMAENDMGDLSHTEALLFHAASDIIQALKDVRGRDDH